MANNYSRRQQPTKKQRGQVGNVRLNISKQVFQHCKRVLLLSLVF